MKLYDASCEIKNKLEALHPYDEDALTDMFLNHTANNRHIKSFRFNKRSEKQSGADWLWLVVTESKVYCLLLQAKKLDGKTIRKGQAFYNSGQQLTTLLDYAETIQAVPLYILYSSHISLNPCNKSKTEEAVFFEPAARVKQMFEENTPEKMKHRPITCLFSCHNKHCYYSNEVGESKLCKACRKCKHCSFKQKTNAISACTNPFEKFFEMYYQLKITHKQITDEILTFMYAESVLARNTSLTFAFANRFLKGKAQKELLQGVILSEYISRHDDTISHLLMGDGFAVDHDSVLDIEMIRSIVKEELSKTRGLFTKIGIFGSYARNDRPNYRDEVRPPSAESDVDIAIVYSENALQKDKHIDSLLQFLKNVVGKLRKNVDFVDYVAATADNVEFKESIDRYMDWIL